ncbi:MAG: cellulase family glycosylhydrolase [candidate division KSB1 bacterium]|nr:cellulase family glycosylhydrolase [candidate division KSB1 bacterium]
MRMRTITIATLVFLGCISQLPAQTQSVFKEFITVDGSRLMQGEQEFRFISWNIPNLNFVEDEMAFTREHEYALPTAYEIRDALESVKQMGGRVVRAYTFPVRSEEDAEGVPKYVLGPGEFNERAFATMDTVLAIANQVGVRVILPFLNQWKWMGGRPQYAAFRAKSEDDFYTDRQLIDDFKTTIEYVITRENTVTGVQYRDDKAIMCWETGNELVCPYEWTREIARLIKNLDINHLLMDGYHAIDSRPVREESITDPNVDIISSHHYETDPEKIFKHIQINLDHINGRKPYVLGEFGFVGTPVIEKYLDWVMDNPIPGALIWSLRYHRHHGGFYWHSEPLGGGVFKAYHWPGFDSGEEY